MVVGVWQLFLVVFDVDPFVGRTPADVWAHLVTAPDAAAHRARRWSDALVDHAGATRALGLVAGTVAALVDRGAASNGGARSAGRSCPSRSACSRCRSSPSRRSIALVFGRGLATTTVIAGLVTFFPTLVIVNLALARRAAPDGRPAAGLRRVADRRPSGSRSSRARCPRCWSSLRIAMPLALVGALLAEWLRHGRGPRVPDAPVDGHASATTSCGRRRGW